MRTFVFGLNRSAGAKSIVKPVLVNPYVAVIVTDCPSPSVEHGSFHVPGPYELVAGSQMEFAGKLSAYSPPIWNVPPADVTVNDVVRSPVKDEPELTSSEGLSVATVLSLDALGAVVD